MLELATHFDIYPMETKASDIIISDVRDAVKFKRYVREEKPRIARQVKSLWKDMGEAVDLKMAKSIIAAGGVPQKLNDIWREMIIDFVREDLAQEWIRNINKAGEIIERKVNRIKVKQFNFTDTVQNVKTWIDTQGGNLIVDLSQAQYKSAQAMIQQQVTWGVTSPHLMAQRILPTIGLTNRESLAVAKFMAGLAEEGIPSNLLNKQVKQYAKFLHNNRAFRIARTEISDSYNFGQMDSVRQAMEAGYLPGEPEKSWIAGGIDPCEDCMANEGEGKIPIDQAFSSGDEHPTAHPNCECSVGYSIRRN